MRTSKKLTLAAVLLAQLPALYAATVTWTGATDGNWATAGNWSPAAAPLAADTALFTNNTNTAVSLAANTSIQSIQFGTSSVGSFTFSGSKFISNASGSTLTVLNTVTNSPTITFSNEIQTTPSARTTSAGYTIANNSQTASLVFNGNLYGNITTANVSATLSFRGTGTAAQNSSIVVNSVISDGVGGGRLALLKTGGAAQGGTLTLNGANTYSGSTEFGNASGTIVLGNKSALGTGSLRIASGSGILMANTNLTGANAVANTIDYTGTLSGTATTTNASLAYTAGSNIATLNSGVSPAVGDLITAGNGQLQLNTRVTAVNGNQITLSANAALTNAAVTGVATTPYTSAGGGTFTIGGANNIEFSGAQNLTTAWSNGGAATQNFNVTNTGVTTFSGALQQQAGVASVTKSGAGVLIFSGANTYTGPTTVSAGTLLLNSASGSATGTAIVNVNSGGTLGGNGQTSSIIAVNSGGALRIGGSTGTSTGVLTVNNTGFSALVLATGSTTVFDVNGATRGTGFDAFDTTGRVNYGGDFTASFGALAPAGTTVYDLFGFASIGASDFNSVSIGGSYSVSLTLSGTGGTGVWAGTAIDGTTFSLAQATGDLTVVSAVPEPATYAGIVGALALGCVALRRRRSAV